MKPVSVLLLATLLALSPVLASNDPSKGWTWCNKGDYNCFSEPLVDFPIPVADLFVKDSEPYIQGKDSIESDIAQREPDYYNKRLRPALESLCAKIPVANPVGCEYKVQFEYVHVYKGGTYVIFKPGWGGWNSSNMAEGQWDVNRLNARGTPTPCTLGDKCYTATRTRYDGKVEHTVGTLYNNSVIIVYNAFDPDKPIDSYALAAQTLDVVKSLGFRTGVIPSDSQPPATPTPCEGDNEHYNPLTRACDCDTGHFRDERDNCVPIPALPTEELDCDNGVDDDNNGETDCKDTRCLMQDPVCGPRLVSGDGAASDWKVCIIGARYIQDYLPSATGDSLSPLFMTDVQRITDALSRTEPFRALGGRTSVYAFRAKTDLHDMFDLYEKIGAYACGLKGANTLVYLYRTAPSWNEFGSHAYIDSHKAKVFVGQSPTFFPYQTLHEIAHAEFGLQDEYQVNMVRAGVERVFGDQRNCFQGSDLAACETYYTSTYGLTLEQVDCQPGCWSGAWSRASKWSLMNDKYEPVPADNYTPGFNPVQQAMIRRRFDARYPG